MDAYPLQWVCVFSFLPVKLGVRFFTNPVAAFQV